MPKCRSIARWDSSCGNGRSRIEDMKLRLTVVAVFCACWLNGQQTAPQPEGPTIPKLTDVNQDILNLVIHDQWDRGMDMFGGRTVRRADAPAATRKNDEEAGGCREAAKRQGFLLRRPDFSAFLPGPE